MNDQAQPSSKKLNPALAIILVLLVMQILGCLVAYNSAMKKIEEASQIKLQLPEELNDEIVKSVKASIDAISLKAQESYDNVVLSAKRTEERLRYSADSIVADVNGKLVSSSDTVLKKTMDCMSNRIENIVNSVMGRLDIRMAKVEEASSNMLNQMACLSQKIDGYVARDEIRIAEFLRVARDDSKPDEIRTIMYLAALELSELKSGILSEYVAMQMKLSEKSLVSGDVNAAQVRTAALSELISATAMKSSPKDIEALISLRSEVGALVARCEEETERKMATEREQLFAMTNGFDYARATRSTLEDLRKMIDAFQVNKELDEDKSALLDELSNRIAAEVPMEGSVDFPKAGSQELISRWCDGFERRISNPDISVSNRFEDVIASSEHIQEVAAVCGNVVSGAVSRLERAVRTVCQDYLSDICQDVVSMSLTTNVDWQAVLTRAESALEKESLLSNYGVSFNPREKISLQSIVYAGMLVSLSHEWHIVKELETCVSSEVFSQMVSMSLSQHIQLVMKMRREGVTKIAPIAFIYNEAVDRMNAFASLNKAMSNEREITSIHQYQSGEQAYLKKVKSDYETARTFFSNAKSLEDKFFTFNSNKNVQGGYKQAWGILAKIHPDDLRSVSPEDLNMVEKLKQACEDRTKIEDYDRKIVEYYRLSDFTVPDVKRPIRSVTDALQKTREWLEGSAK